VASIYLGVIPARGGSKGIPRKNIAMLGSRPLVEHTMRAALESVRLDRVLLTSDDPEIVDLARSFGVEAPFERPAHLATDEAPSVDTVLHALDWLRDEEGYAPDAVVLLQPTSPFRTASDIDEAVSRFEEAGSESLFSVSPAWQHPREMIWLRDGRPVWILDEDERGEDRGRGAAEPCYFIDGAIYIVTPRLLRSSRRFATEDSSVLVLDEDRGLDIDTPFHLEVGRGLLGLKARGSGEGDDGE
jgi:CMP-N-acetylneuraminic acid synthetase